jgi:hypothetical protein
LQSSLSSDTVATKLGNERRKNMKIQRQLIPVAGVLALLLATTITFVTSSSAQDARTAPAVTIAQLEGPWQATLIGNTGCGLVSMLVNFTLNSSGVATNATITTHLSGPNTSGCIDGTVTTDQTFTINSLNSDGSGTAGLSCGSGCGWVFQIQVVPQYPVIANLTDVDTANPYNTPTGTMIRQ